MMDRLDAYLLETDTISYEDTCRMPTKAIRDSDTIDYKGILIGGGPTGPGSNTSHQLTCMERGHVWQQSAFSRANTYALEDAQPTLIDTDSMSILKTPAQVLTEICRRCKSIRETEMSPEVHKVLWRRK